MKTKFYLKSKPAKDGKSAIYCYVMEYNDILVIPTGQRIKPNLWDRDSGRANPRLTRDNILKDEIKNLNNFLDALEFKINKIERTIRDKQPDANFDIIAEAIKRQFNKKKDGLFDIYDEFISLKQLTVSKNFLFKHKRTKELLLEYQRANREILNFDKITPLFFDKFKAFLINNIGMINNTAYKHITLFKTFLIWANDNGYTENKSYKKFKSEWEENEVIYLTEPELMKLYNLQIENERLERVRDIFVFQCFTGVRYSDIQNISRDDIKNSVWKVRTQKTHQIIEIPLNNYALSILAKYNDYQKPLPVISNQKMNDYLKELCKIAGIDDTVKTVKYKGTERIENTYKKYELIGTHTARRTFVSLSLQKGMKPEIIMAITGHTTYKMMRRYLKIDFGTKRNEMDKVWGSNLRIVNNK